VLDAFACTDGMPAEISAGKVMKEPPPASAFIVPAKRPAPKISA
jgi:hypothetical protein